MATKALEDYDPTMPPVSVREMNRITAQIQSWHSSGAKLSETPVDALITNIHQTNSTAHRLLNDLEGKKAESIHLHRKQKFLDTFRNVLRLHARSQLDVAGLQANAASIKSETEGKKVAQRDNAAKWAKLARMLEEKETLIGTIAYKVEDLQAERENEEWSDAVQSQEEHLTTPGGF